MVDEFHPFVILKLMRFAGLAVAFFVSDRQLSEAEAGVCVGTIEEKPVHGDGSLLEGFGMGCLTQFVLGLLSLLAAVAGVGSIGKYVVVLAASWGLTQWIIIVPFIMRQRAKGHPKTVRGLLIAGGVGVLLSSACAMAVK